MDSAYNLLIVEDNPDTSTMLQQFFKLHGYKVQAVGWGKEAIEHCQKKPPDLVLLDIGLPDMDGYEVYARMRRQTCTQNTPVIFLTEQKGRNDKITGLQLGAVDYITKPFDLEELLLRVRNTLRHTDWLYMENLVTELVVDSAMKEELQALVTHKEWGAIYLRLQNMEFFEQTGGSAISNRALQLAANTLNETAFELGDNQDFVSHLGKFDLVLITTPARLNTLHNEVVTRLSNAFRQFIASSFDKAKNGEPAQLPFSVAIGLLTCAGD